MTHKEPLAYWTWNEDLGGGYAEVWILSIYPGVIELLAHIDYRESRPPERWPIHQVYRMGMEGLPANIPPHIRTALFEKLREFPGLGA